MFLLLISSNISTSGPIFVMKLSACDIAGKANAYCLSIIAVEKMVVSQLLKLFQFFWWSYSHKSVEEGVRGRRFTIDEGTATCFPNKEDMWCSGHVRVLLDPCISRPCSSRSKVLEILSEQRQVTTMHFVDDPYCTLCACGGKKVVDFGSWAQLELHSSRLVMSIPSPHDLCHVGFRENK